MSKESFPGFPARSSVTPLPEVFFTRLLPEADSLPELKVVLHVYWRLYRRQASLKFVTFEELAADATLMGGLAGDGDQGDTLRQALQGAIDHGILLRATVESDGQPRDVYFVNGEASQQALAQAKAGELYVPPAPAAPKPEPPNIYVLYEKNIGVLTPMIADLLRDAEELYPAAWIDEAFREAVSLNKRNWKYISRILERWATEGKTHGKPGGDTGKKGGPGRYFKGKYGYLVRR